MKSPEFQDIAL